MAYIGNTVENQGFTPAIDYFNGNGVTVTFTLSRPIASVAQVIVAVDNVIQNPSSAFNVVGNSITFTSAPLSGTNNIWVEYTSLITTYQGISQDPTVIGDIRATGGYLAEGDFGNSFIDGAILDYVTGAGRVTVGELDDLIFYHGGTAGRSEMMKVSYAGNSTLVGNLAISGSATIQGLTVGKGGGAVATNTAVGSSALSANTTGAYMTAVNQSLRSNTSGNYNVGIGWALNSNTTGSNNVGTGLDCLATNTTGGSNTAYGVQALTSNTTASQNTAVGYQAGYSNTTGTYLTALGYQALYSSTGSYNTAVGMTTLRSNTTGTNNTAIGGGDASSTYPTLYSNTTGSYNTAVGNNALGQNTTASQNTAVGYQAGYSNTTGIESVYIGASAGDSVTTGNHNVYVGFQAGENTTTGNGNICIGKTAKPSGTTTSDEIVMGANTTGKGGSTGFINPSGGGVFQGNNSSTWSVTSDQRLKKNIVDNNDGLDIISQIQVRNFEYRLPEEVTDLPQHQAVTKTGVQLGVIAQELQAVCPDCVTEQSTGVLSVDSDEIFWHLVNAVKQLNSKVEAQALEIATLKAAK